MAKPSYVIIRCPHLFFKSCDAHDNLSLPSHRYYMFFVLVFHIPDNYMNEVFVRITPSFSDVYGGQDDINGGSYNVAGPFDPTLGVLCEKIKNLANSEIRELYCLKSHYYRFVVLHTFGTRLQFCEIEVNRQSGKKKSLVHACINFVAMVTDL